MKYDPAFIEAIKRYTHAVKWIAIAPPEDMNIARAELSEAEAHLDSFGEEKKD